MYIKVILNSEMLTSALLQIRNETGQNKGINPQSRTMYREIAINLKEKLLAIILNLARLLQIKTSK